MTGKIIILFLFSVNFALRIDKEHIKRGRANLLDLEMPAPGPSSPAVLLPAASRCSWWPFCMSDTFICNGTQKSLCTVYGSNGSKQSEAPSELAFHVQFFVLISWVNKQFKIEPVLGGVEELCFAAELRRLVVRNLAKMGPTNTNDLQMKS